MKIVRDVMTTEVVHLSPTNKVKTAIILMKGHNIGGLPVVDDDRVVGMLDYQDILGKENDVPVRNVMDREFVTIPPEMPVLDAADLMTKINASRLLVLNGGGLAGVVTRGDLLPELGKSVDPITGLLRADSMRDWGIAALKHGREITLIFLDLDNFGQFNKRYGHIIGDKVLQHVARLLKSIVNDDRDMLCRYAGDEFVIVTTRNSDEALDLANRIDSILRETPNPEIPEPITGSIGLHGGKRTKEREDLHYSATLDNLINLASKACTLAKSRDVAVSATDGGGAAPVIEIEIPSEPKPASTGATGEEEKRLRIQGLNFSWTDTSVATAEVELSNGVTSFKRSRNGFALGNNALRLVAEATAQAVSEFLPDPRHGVIAENVNVIPGGVGEDIVLVTALLITPQSQVRVSGSALVRQDAYKAVSAALLDALNRQLSSLL